MEVVPERLINPFGRRAVKLNAADLTISQKQWFVNEVIHYEVTYKYLTDRYGLHESYVKGLVYKHKNNKIMHCAAGRPEILGAAELENVKQQVSAGVHNMNRSEFGKILQAELVAKRTKETGVAECSIPQMSRRTTNRNIRKMGLKLGYAEQTTDARAVATANKYNAVSVAVAHHLVMPLTNPDIAVNVDGTSYHTGGALTDKIQVIYDPEEQKARGGPLKVLPVKGSCLTAYFVKFYLCMYSTGTTTPPIYICADDHVVAGEIDDHLVPDLGIGTDLRADGYVVFAKTRSVNEEFYRWWFVTICDGFAYSLQHRRLGSFLPHSRWGGYADQSSADTYNGFPVRRAQHHYWKATSFYHINHSALRCGKSFPVVQN